MSNLTKASDINEVGEGGPKVVYVRPDLHLRADCISGVQIEVLGTTTEVNILLNGGGSAYLECETETEARVLADKIVCIAFYPSEYGS